MSEILDRYARLADAFAATVASVPAGRWESPSPCEGWTARDVVRHLVEVHGTFLSLVGRKLPGGPDVAGDPAGAFAAASAAVRAGLADPELASASYEGRFGRSTFEAAVNQFVCFDLVVHRWDLARAAGVDERMDPGEVSSLLEQLPAFGDALHTSGACGPPLDPPPGADEQTRVLALLGRRAWPG